MPIFSQRTCDQTGNSAMTNTFIFGEPLISLGQFLLPHVLINGQDDGYRAASAYKPLDNPPENA
jgi:hypothetical protein